MREQRAAEDRAIFDAYRNGGQFQGKPVDDARILGYIRSRRDSFSKDDPLYDQWNNTFIQTNFSIGEQKIGLAFKEGRASAGAVAAFYRDQLKSLTPDSDFYRDVAGRAAEWSKAAAGAARAAAGSRLRKQIEAAEKNANVVIEGFQAIDATLERAAREAGVIGGNQSLTDANASALFALLDRGVMGADGTPITYSEWQSAAVASWKAQGTVIDLRKQGDFAYIELQNQREKFMSNYLVQLNAADDRQKYEAARETWLTSVAESQGDPNAILEANTKYAQTLTGIRDAALKGESQNDPDFIGGLASEINAVTGKEPTGPTVSDIYGASFVGQPGGAGGFATGNDAQDTYEDALRLKADADALASGSAYLGQAEPGGALQVIPYPVGGANDPFGRNGLDQSVQPSIEEINGKQRIVMLQGQPIRAASYVDANGSPVPPERVTQQAVLDGSIELNKEVAPVLGYSFVGPTGGLTYGVIQPNGAMLFTKKNPFTGGAIQEDGQTFLIAGAETIDGEIQPITSGLLKPLSLNHSSGQLGATLLATGAPVSSSDMLRLIDSGALTNVTPEDVEAIRAKSARDIATVSARRDRSFGENSDRPFNPAGLVPPILQSGLLSLLDVVRQGVTTQTALDSGGRKATSPTLAPPPPPVAPAPTGLFDTSPTSPGGTKTVLKDIFPSYDSANTTPSIGSSTYVAVQSYLRKTQDNIPLANRPL